jgi:CspA family cold shock protein
VADASVAGDLPAGITRAYLQGVVKSYDPLTGDGTVLCDADLAEYELSRAALDGSIFRMLRQGQRVVFDLDDGSMATRVRVGSEADMGTPGFPAVHPGDDQHPQGGSDLADG